MENIPKSDFDYDYVLYNAPGGGSYAFKENYVEYLIKQLNNKKNPIINVVMQPNSSPHFGTIFNIGLAFCLCKYMLNKGIVPNLIFDMWDNAKSKQFEINGVVYQKGLRTTGKLIMDDITNFLKCLKTILMLIIVLDLKKNLNHIL
jgi:hypothetical protein